ncbi:MAG: heavy metal sensor histidine kinase [Comamonadaceae bacterium]|nr:heavy metal sensor histidine kinase [Comamonadaceae bacterium]
MENSSEHVQHAPWNMGVIVGQKSPFKLKEIWAIRDRLQPQHRVRELAMFDLGLDSKLRACDMVKMRMRDICHGEHVSPRATVMPQKNLAAIRHHQAYMQSLLQTLWWFVAGAAAVTGVLGWVVVRRGLAPLHSMREQAQGVTAQQLSRRLPVHSVPPELAELAQSFNDMLARLEVAFARLSDFSSDIAHELRTPVSNLMTQTQVTLSRPRSAGDYQAVLESNAEELTRMTRMIADMLLLARAEHGLVLPLRETVNLGSEVRALFDYYEAVADEKGLQLILTGTAGLQVDRLMLRRALGNLLSNAVRHATPATAVQVRLSDTSTGVSIAVENQGDTIPTDLLERVFDRFFRVDPSRHPARMALAWGWPSPGRSWRQHCGQFGTGRDHAVDRPAACVVNGADFVPVTGMTIF